MIHWFSNCSLTLEGFISGGRFFLIFKTGLAIGRSVSSVLWTFLVEFIFILTFVSIILLCKFYGRSTF